MAVNSMPLSPESIAGRLAPYIAAAESGKTGQPGPDWTQICSQLQSYLQLILKWNARINLTAIRNPEEIVRRHFGESLFAGLHLGPCDSLLDFGSGAGFPGIPIQLLRPDLRVTLAESRARKAAFLREVVRTLGLNTEIWADRAEAMPPERKFHTIALRAVDEMDSAVTEAARRAELKILILGTRGAVYPTLPREFGLREPISLPASHDGVLWIAERDRS